MVSSGWTEIGCAIAVLLHDDEATHGVVHEAEVVVAAGRVERERGVASGVERELEARSPQVVRRVRIQENAGGRRVRDDVYRVVVIGPRDHSAASDLELLRLETICGDEHRGGPDEGRR